MTRIYIRPEGQTSAQAFYQMEYCNALSGKLGCIADAQDGEDSYLRILFKEAFNDSCQAYISFKDVSARVVPALNCLNKRYKFEESAVQEARSIHALLNFIKQEESLQGVRVVADW